MDAPTEPLDEDKNARHETKLEHMDRVFGELLQELRVSQAGIQILFAFMLTIAFQSRFPELTSGQLGIYAFTIVMCVIAMAFITGPVAVHRFNFGRRIKPAIVRVSHFMTIIGLIAMMIAVVGAVWLVTSVALNNWVGQAITVGVALLLVVCWIVVPILMLIFHKRLSDELPGHKTEPS